MKLRKIIALSVASASILSVTACGTSKSDGPKGIFITYGEDNEKYAFVNPEDETVFIAELPLDKITDKKGHAVEFDDLEDGDTIQLEGDLIQTNSIPPIYAGIEEVIVIKDGDESLADKYRPLVEQYLALEEDPSMVPSASVELEQEMGTVTTNLFASSCQWVYKNESGEEINNSLPEDESVEPTVLTLEETEEDGTLTFSSKPESFKLLLHTVNGTEEVPFEKDGSEYEIQLKANATYELQGTWANGTVNYKFTTN